MTGLGSCCSAGYLHEGTPSGKFETFNGIKTYVALPSGDYEKSKALLFLTDIYGVDKPNGLLLADSYAAKANVAVYMPDYLNGDAYAEPNHDKLGEWFGKHGKDVTRPPVDKLVAALKEQGVKEYAAIGYCLGGRYVTDLVLDDVVKVGIVAHPSLLEVPKDIEALNAKPAYFLWLNALQDVMFDVPKQKIAKEITKDNPKHEHADFDGHHGFAIRGDPNDEKIRKEADRAFDVSVAFLKAHL